MRLYLALATSLVALAFPATGHAAAGDPDPAFGTGGETVTPIGRGEATVVGLALGPDGSIVVAARDSGTLEGDRDVLLRFTKDGRLDKRFGVGGVARVTRLHVTSAPVIEPDGGLLLAGYVETVDGVVFAVARFGGDGAPDREFGDRGVTVVPFPGRTSWAAGIARDAQGRIVAGGTDDFGFALARLTPGGSLDPSFGDGGRTVSQISSGGARPARMVLDGSGRAVLAGSGTYFHADGRMFRLPVIARFTEQGRLDEAFGSGGIVSMPIPEMLSSASDVLLQPDGSMVATVSGTSRVPLRRYQADGSLDGSFGNGGEAAIDRRSLSSGLALARQPDGKLLVSAADGVPRAMGGWALARVNIDGSLDRSFGDGGVFTTARGPDYWWPSGLGIQPRGAIVVGGASMACGRRVISLIRLRGRSGGPAPVAPAIRGCDPQASKDGRRVSLIVDCPIVAAACKGTFALRHRSTRIGKGRFDLRGVHRYALVRIAVRRGARSLIAHSRRLPATAAYRVRGRAGRARTIVRHLTVRR